MDVLLSATVSKSEGDKKKGFLPEHEGGKQCREGWVMEHLVLDVAFKGLEGVKPT